jgi:uncharacterized protein
LHADRTTSRFARGYASLCLWVLNTALGTLIGTAYLAHVPEEGRSARTELFVLLALVSTVATLALAPGGLSALAGQLVRPLRFSGALQAGLGALFLVLLYADTRLYNLLRYHVNGAVLNVVITPGSGDAIHIGASVWLLAAAALTGLGLLQYAVWRRAIAFAVRRDQDGGARGAVRRRVLLGGAVLLAVVSAEKTLYAAAAVSHDRELPRASQVLPLYPRLPLRRLVEAADPPGLRDLGDVRDRSAADLVYPLARPAIDPAGPRPNVLLLVLDSWRRDAFDARTTPNLYAFGRGGRRFENHLSGGNGTRFAVFSMLYGLHGSYWFAALAARRPPVLVEELEDLGYDLRVFSSASMSFPELRETAWVTIPERVADDYPARRSNERDRLLAARFEAWVASRAGPDGAAPFFAFVLLDGPHQPYDSDGGPFQPAEHELDYLELARSSDPALVERVHNRYLNAVHQADAVAGRLLAALRASGELERTVVIVTGDHGEEFQECGFWGHTSNFSPEQLEVPLFVRGPGVATGVERRPTSHVDLPATVLELLGADPGSRAGWTLGGSLFDPPAERARVAAGWSDVGLWTASGIFRVPLDEDARWLTEVYDDRWHPLDDPRPAFERERPALERLVEECTRFLRR